MSATIKIPRFWAYIACVFLLCWGVGTVMLFVKYQSAQRAWRYKALYQEARMKFQDYERMDKQKTMRAFLAKVTVPEATLSLIKDGGEGKKVNPLNGKGHTVAVIFSAFDCASCMQRELHIWQGFYEKYSQVADVIGIANTSNPQALWLDLRGFVTFPTYVDDKQNSVVAALSISHTPTVLLIDNKTRKIQDVHFGEPDQASASFAFKAEVIKRLGSS